MNELNEDGGKMINHSDLSNLMQLAGWFFEEIKMLIEFIRCGKCRAIHLIYIHTQALIAWSVSKDLFTNTLILSSIIYCRRKL